MDTLILTMGDPPVIFPRPKSGLWGFQAVTPATCRAHSEFPRFRLTAMPFRLMSLRAHRSPANMVSL
jgi:hypothetical protein